jgi:predicted cobalt transporter CbtA
MLIYAAAIMIVVYDVLPPNPDKVAIPMDLVQEFRIASVFTMNVFWVLLGMVFGLFWDKYKPHATTRVAIA